MDSRLRHLAAHVCAPQEAQQEAPAARPRTVGTTTGHAAATAHAAAMIGEPKFAFPLFGPGMAVDDEFVQRFLAEGFVAILPQTEDGPEGRAAAIHTALHEHVPPIVRSEAEAVEYGYSEFLVANEETDGRPMHPVSGENYYKDNATPILPALDGVIEAPNVTQALSALLGPNYMVDSARSAHYTIPGRQTTQDFHRDGSDKRRHHKPRMLMGMYYPQETTVEMGATSIIARSHLLSDYDQGFQDHRVLCSPRRSANEKPGENLNRGGDYLGTGRGALSKNRGEVPEYLGIVRPVVVPAGTLIVMYYDTWHTARPSTLPCNLHLPPAARDPLQTRFFCKFRWWRMEEPTGPSWPVPSPPHAAPLACALYDAPCPPPALRLTPALHATFAYLCGYSRVHGYRYHGSDEDGGLMLLGEAEPTATLVPRLGWYSEAFACALDQEFLGPPPTNPPHVAATGQPAMLASLCAAYVLAQRGPVAWAAMVEAVLCGGVTISPVRAVGSWAAYNAAYGLASVVPTLEALHCIVPPCVASLTSNPYALAPAALRTARDHAAFIVGELLSAALASEALRRTEAAGAATTETPMLMEGLVSGAVEAICGELYAPVVAVAGAAVPQYTAAIEAAGSLGQAAKQHFSHNAAGVDAVVALAAALSHAHERDMAEYRANVDRDPDRAGSGGIPHAKIALSRLGLGVDARGVPLRSRAGDGSTLNVPLIDKDKALRFLFYAT